MDRSIPAIFDSGVFRPLQPVDLAEGTPVEVVPLVKTEPDADWPPGYFEQTAGALVGEVFERPTQGDLPRREDW